MPKMRSEGGPLLATALLALAWGPGLWTGAALLAAGLLLAASWRRARPGPRLAAAFAWALCLALSASAPRARPPDAARDRARLEQELAAVQARAQALLERLEAAARSAAALSESRQALGGRAGAPLFRELERLRREAGGDVALALHADDWTPLAWSGRIVELATLRAHIPARPDVFVVEGSVSTTLISAAAVGAGGGHATAELTVATRRNIRNEYLRDFDLLSADAPEIEVRYVDLRDRGFSEHGFPPLPDGLASLEGKVASRSGSPIATVRATLPRVERAPLERRRIERRVAGAGAAAVLLAWLLAAPASAGRLALFATLLRAAWAWLGVPWPDAGSDLLGGSAYAAALPPEPFGFLHFLARSPLDLLLTAAWLLALALAAARRAVAAAPERGSALRALAADVAGLAVLALAFLALYDTVLRSGPDLEPLATGPRPPSVLVLHAALLLLLGAAAALLVALHALAGPLAPSLGRLALRLLGWAALLALGIRYWPREQLGLPLLPALALYAGTALVGGRARALRAALAARSPEARAGLALAAVAALATLLFPSLVHFEEKSLRTAIERQHAPLVRRQPEWRDYVLRETRRKIDDAGLLESEPSGPHPPEIEELAYAVWSATDLASFGFTSAVEIQDKGGAIVSRFALNLPSLAGSRRPMPRTTDWELTRERSGVASAERPVLHARRLLAYDGKLRGAVHVFVGDDYWNLPFLHSRDPYSVLYRRAGEPVGGRPLGLIVYDAGLANVFSSDEHPPALAPALAERIDARPSGLWTTLPVDGRPHHAYLFADRGLRYGVLYPRAGAGQYLADLLEAVLGLTLLALLLLAVAVLLRSLLGRSALTLGSVVHAVRRRFALRLFVVFLLVAMAPVLVLQSVVERFVSERLRRQAAGQALELAAVARKAVEDFALFQRDEAPQDQPVTDPALVWVASLIQNDLDVFEGGRLLASSKRELYASGLLPRRLSGELFRALVLEGQGSSLRTESIGGFSYQVVSVPLRFQAGGPRVLSIPLALRQRELEAVLEDLRRSIRLGSLLFLGAAAALAVSMARRISGPVRALTAATQRVAEGDFAARVSATTRDEFQDLVESFNRMAQDLDRQRRDLEHTNRLAAWADMARQVAHEVKNPLTPIQLAAEHLRRVWADGGADFGRTLQGCTDTILNQVRTLREIVTEFSSFARPPQGRLERLSLGPLVCEVARGYREVLPPEVRLEVEGSGDGPAVAADRRLVERAIVNLVENALQAVGEAGEVRLRVKSEPPGRAVVEIEDSGSGLDPETRERAFEPFFSTKANGSGLGLALVKKIAEDHGGGVSLESLPGRPTRARLWLPAAPAAPEAR